MRKTQLLTFPRRAFSGIVPCADFLELMGGQAVDFKLLLQFLCGEVFAKIVSKLLLAMFAQAIMTIKIVDYEPVYACINTVLHPGFEHFVPVGVVEAGPIFLHPSNGISVVRERCPISFFFQQLQGALYRLGAELFFIP